MELDWNVCLFRLFLYFDAIAGTKQINELGLRACRLHSYTHVSSVTCILR